MLAGMATGARFRTVVQRSGGNATGLPVPEEVIAALGAGRRPPLAVTLAGYTYRTTPGVMGGRVLIPLAAEHRAAAGVEGGQEVEVEVQLDEAPREVEVPPQLAAALAADEQAQAFFASLTASQRKEWVRWVGGAAKEATRAARTAQAVEELRSGRKRH